MTNPQLPFSQAAQNNQLPILQVLKHYITGGELLEIGHGNGQHAVFMSEDLKISWYPTDVEENLWIIEKRRELNNLEYLQAPRALRVGTIPLSEQISKNFDYIYTANTLHIMSLDEVVIFCQEVGELLKPSGFLFIYGPFKFDGSFTSDSNLDFDLFLKSNNSLSGIRDFERIETELRSKRISFEKRYDLPANNQLLVFRKDD